MSKPLVVSIPHRLGKREALRRLKTGLGGVGTDFSHLFSVEETIWTSDRVQFRLSALGQPASGSIVVAEEHVHLEVMLPGLLAMLAESLQPLIQRECALLLEKK